MAASGQSDLGAADLSFLAFRFSRDLVSLRAVAGARRGEHAMERVLTPAAASAGIHDDDDLPPWYAERLRDMCQPLRYSVPPSAGRAL